MAKYTASSLKRVTVIVDYPGYIYFSDGTMLNGGCTGKYMTCAKIRECLINHATVYEILDGNVRVKLTFINYMTDNSDAIYDNESSDGTGSATGTLNERMSYCLARVTAVEKKLDQMYGSSVYWKGHTTITD